MKFSKNISVASNKLEGVVIILDFRVVVVDDFFVDIDDGVIEIRSNRDVAESWLGGVEEEGAEVQSP